MNLTLSVLDLLAGLKISGAYWEDIINCYTVLFKILRIGQVQYAKFRKLKEG